MNKKGLVLVISGLLITAAQANYISFVSKDKNEYENKNVSSITKFYSDWNYLDEDCSYDILPADVYYNKTKTQTGTCDVKKERTYTIRTSYVDGSYSDNNTRDYVEETETRIEDITGTHLESTCLDIINNGYSAGDGEYVITQSGNPTVYCDMTRNGGGWLRVINYDYDVAPDSYPSVLVKRVGRVVNGITYPTGWWIPDYSGNSDGANRWIQFNVTPIYAWSDTMIDMKPIYFSSMDGLGNTHGSVGNRNTIEGQYVDGVSITTGADSARTHIYTFANTVSGGSTSNIYSLMGSYYTVGVAEYNGILGKPLTSKRSTFISTRFMADQGYTDESVGMDKYILWVR